MKQYFLISCFACHSLYREVDKVCKELSWSVAVEKAAVLEEGEADWGDEIGRAVRGWGAESASEQQGPPLPPPPPSTATKTMTMTTEASKNRTDKEPSVDDIDLAALSTKDWKRATRKSKKAARRAREKDADIREMVEKEKRRVEERKERKEREGQACSKPPCPSLIPSASMTTAALRAFKCNTCGASWSNSGEHRAHYKSDWHRYNLKLKQAGADPVTEQEFVDIDNDALFLGG